jgi:hypothetical protein
MKMNKQENKLQQTTMLLDFINYEFGCLIDEVEKCRSIGSTYSDEEVAYRYKNNLWKNEWLDEYRDSKGNLTETFFEDVNESQDFICCDSCKKWGYVDFNYIFEGDFYCDLCHIKDTLKDFDKAIKILKENEDES